MSLVFDGFIILKEILINPDTQHLQPTLLSPPRRYLSHNKISVLLPGVFQDLHKLEWLYVLYSKQTHLNTNEKNTFETLLYNNGLHFAWVDVSQGDEARGIMQLLLNQFCKISLKQFIFFYVGSWKIITSIKYPPWPFQAWTLSSCCESLFILHFMLLCCYPRDLLQRLTEVRLNVSVTLGGELCLFRLTGFCWTTLWRAWMTSAERCPDWTGCESHLK